MGQKVRVCIPETLQRVIEVDIDKIEDPIEYPIEYAREQYFSEEIILDSSDLVDTEFKIYE